MNKKKIILIVISILSLILVGCDDIMIGVSVEPFYTKKDLVFKPELEGRWIDSENDAIFDFTVSEDSTYYLKVTDIQIDKTDSTKVKYIELPGELDASLFKLDGHLLFDWFPREPETDNIFYTGHLIPLHSIWKVKIESDTLVLTIFSPEDVGEDKLSSISYQTVKKNHFFTASTDTLQMFIKENYENLFNVGVIGGELTFYRQK